MLDSSETSNDIRLHDVISQKIRVPHIHGCEEPQIIQMLLRPNYSAMKTHKSLDVRFRTW
jgi:hypothetical protein